ncbi:hypothetical protein CVT24_012858 [Panaeolus cyanescens]|uniref:Uncharacterized protein n=1 Tax=Panaeolus cyanescens TaxID=181874 RepID=A0A409X4L8_9AGAR|nr:hypothetical protein CVT24_012858 [Panaeolus cyanescens]
MQRKAVLWITGAFCTSPSGAIEAMAALVPILLMLKRLTLWSSYQVSMLADIHPLRSLLSKKHTCQAHPHSRTVSRMTDAHKAKVQSAVMEVDDNLDSQDKPMQGFPPEACPGHQLLDCYSDCIDYWNTAPGTLAETH